MLRHDSSRKKKLAARRLIHCRQRDWLGVSNVKFSTNLRGPTSSASSAARLVRNNEGVPARLQQPHPGHSPASNEIVKPGPIVPRSLGTAIAVAVDPVALPTTTRAAAAARTTPAVRAPAKASAIFSQETRADPVQIRSQPRPEIRCLPDDLVTRRR
jgi:hypothetical protein